MTPMSRKFAIAAGIGAAALGGAAIAGAASGPSGSPSASKRAEHHQDEKPLTGETASKVRAAALAKVPGGKVLRVESDRGGVYEAHVQKSDGSEVEVKVDKSFNATEVLQRGERGPDGHGRGEHGGGANEKALTGETASKVRAAALAKVPGGKVLRVESDRGGVYEAHVQKSDGSEVEVKVDKSFKVTSVEEHDGSRRP
jgi:uncharacterized membrane protein YkoI